MSSKHTQKSTKASGRKTSADIGLTDKERIFVHALRDLFDPKGKGKDVSSAAKSKSPKSCMSKLTKKSSAFVSRDGVAAKSQESRKSSTEGKPKSKSTTSVHQKEAIRRKKRNANSEERAVAEKRKKVVKLSPSQQRRAVKRQALFEGLEGVYNPLGVVKATKSGRPAKKSQNLIQYRRLAPVGRINRNKEVEAVQAFGGEQCLRMLSNIPKKTKEYKSVVWGPNILMNRVSKETRDFGNVKTTRDFSKISNEIGRSEKNKSFYTPTARGLRSKVGIGASEKVAESKSEEGMSVPKTPKKVKPSTARREKRRSEAREKKLVDEISELKRQLAEEKAKVVSLSPSGSRSTKVESRKTLVPVVARGATPISGVKTVHTADKVPYHVPEGVNPSAFKQKVWDPNDEF